MWLLEPQMSRLMREPVWNPLSPLSTDFLQELKCFIGPPTCFWRSSCNMWLWELSQTRMVYLQVLWHHKGFLYIPKLSLKRPLYRFILRHPCAAVSNDVLLPCITDWQLIGRYEHQAAERRKTVICFTIFLSKWGKMARRDKRQDSKSDSNQILIFFPPTGLFSWPAKCGAVAAPIWSSTRNLRIWSAVTPVPQR